MARPIPPELPDYDALVKEVKTVERTKTRSSDGKVCSCTICAIASYNKQVGVASQSPLCPKNLMLADQDQVLQKLIKVVFLLAYQNPKN